MRFPASKICRTHFHTATTQNNVHCTLLLRFHPIPRPKWLQTKLSAPNCSPNLVIRCFPPLCRKIRAKNERKPTPVIPLRAFPSNSTAQKASKHVPGSQLLFQPLNSMTFPTLPQNPYQSQPKMSAKTCFHCLSIQFHAPNDVDPRPWLPIALPASWFDAFLLYAAKSVPTPAKNERQTYFRCFRCLSIQFGATNGFKPRSCLPIA